MSETPMTPEELAEIRDRTDRQMEKCRRRGQVSLADLESSKNDVHDLATEVTRLRDELAARPSRAAVLREAQGEVVAWLEKKAREYRSTGSQQHAMQADAISTMADKARRGAVRVFLAAEQADNEAPHTGAGTGGAS